jgi:hypothetical protein
MIWCGSRPLGPLKLMSFPGPANAAICTHAQMPRLRRGYTAAAARWDRRASCTRGKHSGVRHTTAQSTRRLLLPALPPLPMPRGRDLPVSGSRWRTSTSALAHSGLNDFAVGPAQLMIQPEFFPWGEVRFGINAVDTMRVIRRGRLFARLFFCVGKRGCCRQRGQQREARELFPKTWVGNGCHF